MATSPVKQRYGDIVKSAQDKRAYQGLELQNGMKVLLISDPDTDKSSAALDVNIGHMSDPWELPGLAHFCEHMLFLGTEKYPSEEEYNKFLSEHGGSSNAFTSLENTNYYFDVTPEHLGGALDRFAQFFLCPLFTDTATDREVNAVNSENDRNLQNDAWRLSQLEKATSNPKHDFYKFGTGNKNTLMTLPKEKGINTREELLKFHKKYYSSNIMALCVLGKETLEELETMVLPYFTAVENKSVQIPEWLEHPYGNDELQLQVEVVPVKDIRSLHISWPMEDLHPYYKTNPGHYLGHLIGHEGEGSLLSELKAKGWVNALVGGEKGGAKGFMFFIVNVDLTEEGLKHTEDIVTMVYQYLNMLKKDGPQQWVFQECQDLSAMQFRFKDKEKPRNYTTRLASTIHLFPMGEVLTGPYLCDEYKPELITKVLDKLTVNSIRVAVISQSYQGKVDQKEKWYGTEYCLAPIPQETLQRWKNAGLHDKLYLPSKNEFIPTDFDITPREDDNNSLPQVIRDTELTRLWYKQDEKFLLPKACTNIELICSHAYTDPLSTNLSYMYTTLLLDALNEYAYSAELAGISYNLYNTHYGMGMSLSGYHHKQHILLQKILDKLTNFTIDAQRFAAIKEAYIRSLKNFRAEQPHQHAVYYTTVMTCEQMWTKDDLMDAVDEITIENLKLFIPQLLSRMFFEMLVYGNITKEKAKSFADIVEKTLQSESKTKALLPSQMRRFREVQLPDGCYYVYKHENEVHKSSSLEVYLQCNLQETHPNMLLELFCQIIAQPCFDVLRTKEQLGYIVFSGIRRASGVQGLRIIVQSDRTPEYVESRIEAFLHKMGTHISEMSEEEYTTHKTALAARRMEQPKKLSGQNQKYWSEIVSQQYNFDRDNMEVSHLKTLTKENIINFYKELIAHDAPKRHKLSVHVLSTSPDAANANTSNDVPEGLEQPPPLPLMEEVTNVNNFKQGLGLFPLAKSYISISSTKSKL